MIDISGINWIELIGAIAGIIYLYYEYKADIKMWPTGLVMSSFYTIVFIQAKFYAFACINIYYIIAGIYGWIKWYKNKSSDPEQYGIEHMPRHQYLKTSLATIIVFGLITYILIQFTDSPVAYGDSFVTTLSIIAMWMLAYKYVEQWILVIVVNAVSILLYYTQALYPTSIMYFIYTFISILGYFKWKKMIKPKQNENI